MNQTDLKPCDVLLYQRKGLIPYLIEKLDGGPYCHAAFWDGENVNEMLANGIVVQPLASSINKATVDVFRFNKPIVLCQDAVLNIDRNIVIQKDAYAYDEILLLAFLGASRQINLDLFEAMLLREVLDRAASMLVNNGSKKPMICSEFVYRCFAEAIPAGIFELAVRDLDIDLTDIPSAFPEEVAFVKAWEGARSSCIEMPCMDDFVTPHDLCTSPDLQRIGTLC
jgi:hypothetical protein